MVEQAPDAAAVAPTVRIVNFSVGDDYQPFLHTMSPIAKLIDEVLAGEFSAMDIAEDAVLEIPVACFPDAVSGDALSAVGIPYALAISLEVAPKTRLPIYEQVRTRIRPRVPVAG